MKLNCWTWFTASSHLHLINMRPGASRGQLMLTWTGKLFIMIQKKKLLYIRLFLGLHRSYQQEKLYIYIYDKYILYIYLEHGRAVFVRAPKWIGGQGRGVVLSDCHEVQVLVLAKNRGACVQAAPQSLGPWRVLSGKRVLPDNTRPQNGSSVIWTQCLKAQWLEFSGM